MATNANRTLYRTLAAAALSCASTSASAQPVFYLDDRGRSVIQLDQFASSEAAPIRGILALYALENGAGCRGRNKEGLVECELTTALGLGANCSADHLSAVRSWFAKTPRLTTRWHPSEADTKKAGTIESLCYNAPDTSTWQNIYTRIEVTSSEGHLVVDADVAWISRYGSGESRYHSVYKIEGHTVVEVSTESVELERSDESPIQPYEDGVQKEAPADAPEMARR